MLSDCGAAWRRIWVASRTMPADDMFWGDRFGTVTDPFGHAWHIATHTEDVPLEEMEERAKAAMASMG